MAVYDLDKNEHIDIVKINGKEYEIGDIPYSIIVKIRNIKTGMFADSQENQWKPIIKEILEIRNKDLEIDNLTNEKIAGFMKFLKDKLGKGQIG